MIIQCIARAAHGLPLALLEVHTMVHVVCAGFLYALWLKKPLDVHEPVLVDPADWMDFLAVLILKNSGLRSTGLQSTFERLVLYPNNDSSRTTPVLAQQVYRNPKSGSSEVDEVVVSPPRTLISPVPWRRRSGGPRAGPYYFSWFVSYMLARTYQIVESFVSLRSVPIGVFWTPSWIQMLPHI
ncbi:hypothetical protein QBC46DRAFT_419077 [Diplogelasinospora grovesii]|uniref:Uncharacterized protein n=1 Tax=Diplogelasinospora grovesii TaxID=303347 RepID=A0AAN6MZR5_9PEZI|nr:hypothetical protein QBC46DRAFT_419077 [Diplogelasinospora grovesii]